MRLLPSLSVEVAQKLAKFALSYAVAEQVRLKLSSIAALSKFDCYRL